jgi:hypothetical protein
MKKTSILAAILVFGLATYSSGQDCTTIKAGIPYSPGHYLAGSYLKVGFDIFGYNYQAHLFNGYYANVYLGGDGLPPYEGDDELYLEQNGATYYDAAKVKWYWPYRKDLVNMKWNDAWLAHMDCDGDGKLDRHFGYPSYIGSGAWETNHQSGTYIVDGIEYSWNYFVKIVAVPADATLTNGIWYTASGVEIGPTIWNEFAIIEEIYNDQGTGDHGVLYRTPARAGLGGW